MPLHSGLQYQTAVNMVQVITLTIAHLLPISPSLSVEDSQNDGRYREIASTWGESAVVARGVLELSLERILVSTDGSLVTRESTPFTPPRSRRSPLTEIVLLIQLSRERLCNFRPFFEIRRILRSRLNPSSSYCS